MVNDNTEKPAYILSAEDPDGSSLADKEGSPISATHMQELIEKIAASYPDGQHPPYTLKKTLVRDLGNKSGWSREA